MTIMNKNIDSIFIWVLTAIVFTAKILDVTKYSWIMMFVPFMGYIFMVLTMLALNELASRRKKE